MVRQPDGLISEPEAEIDKPLRAELGPAQNSVVTHVEHEGYPPDQLRRRLELEPTDHVHVGSFVQPRLLVELRRD